MLYMRLAYPFETIALNQFYNPAKTRPHVGWKGLQLVSNADVEHFNDPRHPFIVLHFCNEGNGNEFTLFASPFKGTATPIHRRASRGG